MTGRQLVNVDRVIARLGSASIAELDEQVKSANAKRVLAEHRARVKACERWRWMRRFTR